MTIVDDLKEAAWRYKLTYTDVAINVIIWLLVAAVTITIIALAMQ